MKDCGGHNTTLRTGDGPGKGGLATQVLIPEAMVRVMGAENKSNLRNHILGAFASKLVVNQEMRDCLLLIFPGYED